ncbi:superinfection immunity protein [Pantoea sp. Al-1710]|uniref:Superinfection immunity protein n=1 Tax=Candidatus Pantoea communis TaxID=2608354 RepID=A0ABX0RNQ0_9GAMM|nr:MULTISPECIES: superinfection immunity protein [Pantoea]NIG13009.1 superinfection immunity protein [Pantoea sp. Cy-640]NIG17290.1 superinfection immunity protein [Pantoea communis]
MTSLFLTLILLPLYFLPTFVGILRFRLNIWAIMLTNIFLGWTVIGWMIALIWAMSYDHHQQDDNVINALERRK